VTRIRLAAGVLLTWLAGAGSASAQSPRAGAVEVAVGGMWIGHAKVASGDANETTSTGGDFRLFGSSTTLSATGGFEARVGVKLTNSFEVMAAGSYGTPQLRVALSNDAEGATPVTASERIQQYTITGGVLWYLPNGDHERFSPFVEAEAGISRNLHEGRSPVNSGRLFGAGGGVKIALGGGSGWVRSIGARVDARAVVRSDPTVFDRRRVSPAIGVSLYLRF
jgi:hypothetical protein